MLALVSGSKAARQFPKEFDLALNWIQVQPFYSIFPRPVKIIAVEGLDGTGKSTLVNFLSCHLKAEAHYGLHKELLTHRYDYDLEEESEKRQFYLLGNIALMAELQIVPQKKALSILDRSYATTLSYALGNMARTAQDPIEQLLPPVPIRWPAHLRPDVYIVLHCEEQERLRRVNGRSVVETNEEKDLAASNAMRRTIDYCYRNFEGATVIDTTHLGHDEVNGLALQVINEQLNTSEV